MITFLFLYAVITLLVALRYGWYIYFRLDKYDWHYCKMDILLLFAFCVILWPLMVIKPILFFKPTKLFDDLDGKYLAEKERLRHKPPPCGSVIRYSPQNWEDEISYGEFLFDAIEIEKYLRSKLSHSPHLINDDEGAIFNWLCNYKTISIEPVDVPLTWSRFRYIAFAMAHSGIAKVRCLKCEKEIPTNEILKSEDISSVGHMTERLECSKGHCLIALESFHFFYA